MKSTRRPRDRRVTDRVDQLLAQHEQKRLARRAADKLGNAIVVAADASTDVSFVAVAPVDIQRTINDAVKQLRVAQARIEALVARMPPKED